MLTMGMSFFLGSRMDSRDTWGAAAGEAGIPEVAIGAPEVATGAGGEVCHA